MRAPVLTHFLSGDLPSVAYCGAALASQSLSIMIALIPYVRETFRRHLSTKQAVMLVEFDKLKRVRTHALHHSTLRRSEPYKPLNAGP